MHAADGDGGALGGDDHLAVARTVQVGDRRAQRHAAHRAAVDREELELLLREVPREGAEGGQGRVRREAKGSGGGEAKGG